MQGNIRLAVFDLDGTLKRVRDPYVFVHKRLGTLEASKVITKLGMSGRLPYEEWLRLDVNLWRGVPKERLESIFRESPYMPGAREVVSALKEAGVTVAIVSSGLLLHAQQVAADLEIPIAIGNEIGFTLENGRWVVSGEVRAWCPYAGKGAVVASLQARLGISPQETLAVGDSRGDIPMFRRARVSVAVSPQHEEVAREATWVISEPSLFPLLARLSEILTS